MGYPSVFGGQWVAANFAYGSPGGPAALICQQPVAIPASPLVAASMTLAFSFTVTIDGITFWPLNANAPVNVGSDGNAEKVTVISVSGGNTTTYQGGSFTADFANAHGSGDYVTSATFGLQEALNLAGAAGGGKVIIDEQWVKLGGTTTIKNAATLPSGVTITDNR
jgi:hypothetical protein